jgi:hypothetical protein
MGALLVSCASSTQVPVIANSGSIGNISFNNSNTNAEQPSPKEPSVWIINLPADTAETMYFLGISARKSDLQAALADAENDARIRVSGYIGCLVEEKVEDASAYRTSREKVVENTETAAIASSSYTRAVLNGVKTFGEPQVTRYPDGTVEVQIAAAVDKKLLDKAIADFIRLQDAAKTVRFKSGAFTYTAQKGDRIEISAEISAHTAVDIGAIECVFTYTGVKEAQSVTAAGAARFQVDTAHLPAGKYTGVLELQMQKLSPGIENVRQSVVFEVLPIPPYPAIVEFKGENISLAEKNKIIQGLRDGLDKYHVPIQIPVSQKETAGQIQNRYTFIVSMTEPVLPESGNRLITCNGFIAFTDNDGFAASETYYIGAYQPNGLIDDFKKKITNNKTILEKINRYFEGK